jgi:LCP family protein required for cell wall assembly
MPTHKKTFVFLYLFLVLSSLFMPAGSTPSASASAEKGICNGPDMMTILVLGTDNRTWGYSYGLSDTIMVFRIDFQTPRVTVLGLPRDLWVEIPGIEDDLGITHGKLNMAYLYGTEDMGYVNEPGGGAGSVKATLARNWDLEIDHTFVVNMQIFKEIIDAIGGIEVFNPAPVYSHHKPKNPKVKEGGYLFDGKDAQLYARWRASKNVLDRVDRQAILLDAILKKAFDPRVIPRIPRLLATFKGNVLTDLHLAQISQLLCLASKLDEDDIVYTRIPKDDLVVGNMYFDPFENYVFCWLEKEEGTIQEIMTQFQKGEYPREE